jgi:predicted dehydrogenase
VFQNRRWDSDFLTVSRILATGLVGKPLRVESRFELYRPLNPDAWREDPDSEAAGGVLFDLGSHLIDQAIVLFGHPRSVYSEIHGRRPGAAVDDDTFVSLGFESDVTYHLWMSKCSRGMGSRFRVVGSDAVFEISDMDPQWEALQRGERPGGPSWGVHPSQGLLTKGNWTSPEREVIEPFPGAYEEFYRLLRDALVEGGPLPANPLDAIEVLRVIEAAQKSNRSSKAVSLDPTAYEASIPD